jgi:hypothetical protein
MGQKPPGHAHHLDRVERGEHPLKRSRLHRPDRSAISFFALPGEMHQSGAALEDLQIAVAQEGDLADRLLSQVVGLATVERNGADGIGKTRFLTGPSQTKIAHETARSLGHPVVGPDDQLVHDVRPALPKPLTPFN